MNRERWTAALMFAFNWLGASIAIWADSSAASWMSADNIGSSPAVLILLLVNIAGFLAQYGYYVLFRREKMTPWAHRAWWTYSIVLNAGFVLCVLGQYLKGLEKGGFPAMLLFAIYPLIFLLASIRGLMAAMDEIKLKSVAQDFTNVKEDY